MYKYLDAIGAGNIHQDILPPYTNILKLNKSQHSLSVFIKLAIIYTCSKFIQFFHSTFLSFIRQLKKLGGELQSRRFKHKEIAEKKNVKCLIFNLK